MLDYHQPPNGQPPSIYPPSISMNDTFFSFPAPTLMAWCVHLFSPPHSNPTENPLPTYDPHSISLCSHHHGTLGSRHPSVFTYSYFHPPILRVHPDRGPTPNAHPHNTSACQHTLPAARCFSGAPPSPHRVRRKLNSSVSDHRACLEQSSIRRFAEENYKWLEADAHALGWLTRMQRHFASLRSGWSLQGCRHRRHAPAARPIEPRVYCRCLSRDNPRHRGVKPTPMGPN